MKKFCKTTATVKCVPTLEFKATGAPVLFGAPRDLGKVEPYGDTKTATLLVGLTKGVNPGNSAGKCASAPETFTVDKADGAFEALRLDQVGEVNLAATRRTGKGWYKGAPEKSLTYEVVFIPSTAEPTYEKFVENINKLAESIGGVLCQDAVLVVNDDSDKRHTVGAERE